MKTLAQPVLLYDGECGLCNRIVRLMLKHDRRGVMAFAPLQGRTGQAVLRRLGMDTEDFDSLVFIDDLATAQSGVGAQAGQAEGKATGAQPGYALRSTGALRAMESMGGSCGRVARVLRVVPASWRDGVYRVVARLRYRLFGTYRPTPLPNPEWARRILE